MYFSTGTFNLQRKYFHDIIHIQTMSDFERKYYVESGPEGSGVVQLDEPQFAITVDVSTTPLDYQFGGKSEINKALERGIQEMDETILTLRTCGSIRKTYSFLRAKLREKLQTPALIQVGNAEDQFHMGWWYTIDDSGKLFTAFKNMPDNPADNYHGQIRGFTPRPFLQIDQPEYWKERVEKSQEFPLAMHEHDELINKSNLESTTVYKAAQQVTLEEFRTQTRATIDKFWQKIFPVLDIVNGTDAEKAKIASDRLYSFMSRNALTVAAIESISLKFDRKIRKQLIEKIQSIGVTLYPMKDGALVGYRKNGTIQYKTFRADPSKLRSVQRYLFFGEQPLSEEEVLEQVRRAERES